MKGLIGRETLSNYFDEKEVREIAGAKRIKEEIEEEETSDTLFEDTDLSP